MRSREGKTKTRELTITPIGRGKMYSGCSAGGSSSDDSLEVSSSIPGKAPGWSLQPGQLGQLQRLGQPYFLPLGQCSGWHFLCLLVALTFCVCGAGLLLLTATLHLVFALAPETGERVLSGPQGLVSGLWRGAGGTVILALAIVGALGFFRFRSELRGRWVQWLLLAFIVVVLLSVNAINTGIGFVANYLTQSMVEKEPDDFYRWLSIYASCFVFALPVLTLQYFVKAKLGILWREWLTSSLMAGWMSNRAYYVLNANDEEAGQEGVDNPDQRIAEDVDTFTTMTLEYLIGTIDSLMMFGMNILVLWNISHTLTIVLLSWSVGMTAVILFLSKNLVRVNYRQLKFQADFRYGLVHVRDNAESIAFYSGEASERAEMSNRLGQVVGNYNKLIIWTVGISVVKRMYSYGNVFVPYLVMGPLVLSGKLTYGDFSQANFTFRMVEDALSFIATSINEMTAWVAGITRLEEFQTAVGQVAADGEGKDEDRPARSVRPASASGEGAAVLVHGAELRTPGTGQLLISGLSFSLKREERLLVVGPSGCGKTSLLRMVCGLWRPAAGALEAPPVGELLFVPQKPYMVLGSLREQLAYPLGEGSFSDDQLRRALQEACLGHFVERYPDLGVKQDWARLMSLGEQQRVSFARVLLNAPSVVVLDEASSGLDVATERKLYDLLTKRGISFISVGHRPTLKSFHTWVLELQGPPTGGWQLVPAASYEFGA